VHPTIAEELAKVTQHERLAEAAQYRLAGEARAHRRETRTSDGHPGTAADRHRVRAALRFLIS
jgi:hypothetical protein